MAQQIHYEIFRRVGAKGGWTLHDVRSEREGAIVLATELMAQEKATGVKVVKETYHEGTGDYLSLKIFEDGLTKMAVAPNQEDAPHALPCFKPDDLYNYHARHTMTRLLGDYLARNKITITELIHRADMLEKLEATGTLYQHAIQKVAVAQAASTSTPVQQIVKSLNDLVTQATTRVYRDARANLFPETATEQFPTLAASLTGNSQASYLFNGALARHLIGARGWDEKVMRLLSIMALAPDIEAPRKLLMGSTDTLIAEMLSGSAALQDLMGPAENLAQALDHLVDLFLGTLQPDTQTEGKSQAGLKALAARFAADELPEARTALAARIIAEFKSPKRLVPDNMVAELLALRRIANKIVAGIGKYLSHDDLITAFTLRSRRLVTQEALGQHIAEAPLDDKIDRILFVEENIIGAENKRQLFSFVTPVLNAAPFESHFQNPKLPLMTRLQKLAQIQARVRRSGFIAVQKDEIAARLDALAAQVEMRGKLFESLEARTPNHVEKAQTLLKLVAGGFFTEGRLSEKARGLILGYLSRPGFLAGYMSALPKEGEAKPSTEAAMTGLIETLGKAGISAETGLKNIAA